MRILKSKIMKSKSLRAKLGDQPDLTLVETKKEEPIPVINEEIQAASIPVPTKKMKKRGHRRQNERCPGGLCDAHDIKSTKNIVKNYGRAICNFIISAVSRPYLNDIVSEDHQNVLVESFVKYINERKESIDCIDRLKNMLIVSDKDNEEEAAYKMIFKKIGEIFIKYFSVNWIFSGRLTYKQAHVDFRFKMLRRLRNPELFTHLKSFVKRY
jgi:hypothetical protein